jgi:hypothetical protein
MDDDRKSEIEALEARLRELKAPPSDNTANPAPPEAERSSAKPLIITLLAIGGITLAVCMASLPHPAPSTSAPAPGLEAAAPPAPPGPPPSPWRYTTLDDAMTDAKTELACTTSTNEVQLNPPYGPVTVDLCLRQARQSGLNVLFRLNGDGQIICDSYYGCPISVRFGSAAQQKFTGQGPEDHSSNIIFLQPESRFLAGVQKADITRISVTFYEAGEQVIEFPTRDLEWPRPAASGKP